MNVWGWLNPSSETLLRRNCISSTHSLAAKGLRQAGQISSLSSFCWCIRNLKMNVCAGFVLSGLDQSKHSFQHVARFDLVSELWQSKTWFHFFVFLFQITFTFNIHPYFGSPWYNRNGWLGVKHLVTYHTTEGGSRRCPSLCRRHAFWWSETSRRWTKLNLKTKPSIFDVI